MRTIAEAYDHWVTKDWDSYEQVAKNFPEALPQNAAEFSTVNELIMAVTSSGSHYFEPRTLKYFNSKTDTNLYGKRFFVESIRFENDPRVYRMCWVYREGNQHYSVERLGSFDTLNKARHAARAMSEYVA